MGMIGAGIFWATRMPVHGSFWADLFGPLLVVGIGTAFAFIPISIGALAGVAEHEAGLASGLIYTSQELGGAIGIAIASSVAATHYEIGRDEQPLAQITVQEPRAAMGTAK